MKKQQLLGTMLAAALPLAALAQGGPPAGGQGQGQGPQAQAQGAGPRFSPEKMEKRMRLARTLGLAEALDLEPAAALKLGETIGKFDDRRVAAHKVMHEARDVLRRAAQGEKVAPADVDQAIQKALDARAQLTAIDRETVAAVTQGLSPEKKARAVLFLANFHRRFPGGPGMGHGMHRGMGPGVGPGGGMGPGRGQGRGPGMGPGMMGPGGGWGMRDGAWDGMGPGAHGPLMGMATPPGGGDFFDDEPED
jgi:hypothetical protein